MWRADSLEKPLMLGKIEGRRRRGWQGWDGWMASPTWWTWVWANSRRWWRTGKPGVLQSMRSQRVGHDWTTEQQQAPGRAARCSMEAGLPPSSLLDWSHGFDAHLCPSSDSPASSLSLATAQIMEPAHCCRSIYPKEHRSLTITFHFQNVILLAQIGNGNVQGLHIRDIWLFQVGD